MTDSGEAEVEAQTVATQAEAAQPRPSTAPTEPTQPETAASGSVSIVDRWSDCVLDSINLDLANISPLHESIRRTSGYLEIAAEDLSRILDTNQRDGDGNIQILPTDGTMLTLRNELAASDVHALLVPELEPRLREVADQGATIIVPVVRVNDGGGGYVNVLGFDTFGRQTSVDACKPAGYYDLVPAWRDDHLLALTDLEAWRAVLDRDSDEAQSFDEWALEVFESGVAETAWVDLPADSRQLNPQETPTDILDGLNVGLVAVDLGGLWDDVDGVVCLRLDLAWGECLRTNAGLAILDGWYEDNAGFEIWLLEGSQLSSDIVRLAEVPAELAASMGTVAEDGSELVLSISANEPASTIADLVDAVAAGRSVLTVEAISLDELESRFQEPQPSDNPEGP